MSVSINNLSSQTGTFLSWSPLTRSFFLAAASSLLVQKISLNDMYNTGAIYSGVFDLLSIFTGFLATFYVFVVTKGNHFLEKIKKTKTYSMILTLLKFTIIWSTCMIGFSYVMVVVDASGFDLFSLEQLLVFFWLWNIFLIATNFLRCVVQFSMIVETDK